MKLDGLGPKKCQRYQQHRVRKARPIHQSAGWAVKELSKGRETRNQTSITA